MIEFKRFMLTIYSNWLPCVRVPRRRLSFRCILAGALLMGTVLIPRISLSEGEVLKGLLDDAKFTALTADPGRYRLQIVLGLVDETAEGGRRLTQQTYRAGAEYFYPASSIKLCAAVAALERLEFLSQEAGHDVDVNTPLAYRPLFEDEEFEATDTSNLEGGRITLGHEIRKLFLVSDNVAFNRLYELVGPAWLNESMIRAGLSSTHLVHRLSERRTAAENLRLPQIDLVGKTAQRILPTRTDTLDLRPASVPGLDVGKGYYRDGELVQGAMDFRGKNRISLVDLQRALVKVVRPDVDVGGTGFRLSEEQRQLLTLAMGQLPRESSNPLYDEASYPDDWVKFLLPGVRRVFPAVEGRDRVRIYNKIGQAYGFVTENAYLVDTATDRAFFLAATIYTNPNGVLNDDQYEYTEVALPFMADLGEAVARALWAP